MRTIAVVGATGAQGGAVVRALQEHGGFNVRALTRNPEKAQGLGDEVRAADLDQPETLAGAFEGAHGVFVNTNSFAGPDTDEVAQGRAAVAAAQEAGVEHYIWSTLPDVAAIGGGRFVVPHFTNKAAVNGSVSGAGFKTHTFVEPPFYFQNLISPMYPAIPDESGTPTWSQPMRGDARGIHMGDIDQYGDLVAGAFMNPDLANGKTLSMAGDLVSWDDLITTLRSQGHNIAFREATEDPWGVGDMFSYFAAHTYFGPIAAAKIEAARTVSPVAFTSFADWALKNMPANG